MVGAGTDVPTFRFAPPQGFMADLKTRVDQYFAATGRSPRGGWRLYLKAAIILTWLVASYVLLVFVAATFWQAALASVSLALAVAGVGFNIQHDGNHGAFSERQWLNRLAAHGMELLGGSSYLWRFQHNVFHHTYTNLAGADDDIAVGWVGRLSPAQPHHWFHRFQHVYLWPLYGLMALRWQLAGDFIQIAKGRVGPQRFPRPRGADLAIFVAGKALLVLTAFVIPMLRHPVLVVLGWYLFTMGAVGFTLAVIFQLAHSVEDAAHPGESGPDVRVPVEWGVHQVETTVDFAPRNRPLGWFVGGLNFQVVHHLFPKVAHIHYPALARIVAETCAAFGVRYRSHRTFAGVLASHYRFLRAMGQPPYAPHA